MKTIIGNLSMIFLMAGSAPAQAFAAGEVAMTGPLLPTNKVVMHCEATQRPMLVEIRQFKDASGEYSADSFYVVKSTDYSGYRETDYSFTANLGDNSAPPRVFRFVLDGTDGVSGLDVSALRNSNGVVTTTIDGNLTLTDGDSIAVACRAGAASVASQNDSVLKIEIRKGIVVQGEFATIMTTAGDQLAGLGCQVSHGIDTVNWSCRNETYDLEVGHVVMMSGLMGTLTREGKSYNVTCTRVVNPGPNGVDGPVLEYTCTATPVN